MPGAGGGQAGHWLPESSFCRVRRFELYRAVHLASSVSSQGHCNAGLASMCERGEYEELLVEYGVNYMTGGESNVICEVATAGTSSSSIRRSFISRRLVGIVSAIVLITSSRFW